MRPVCWTQHFRVHGINLKNTDRNVLKQRDIKSGYTVVHAICSSRLELKVICCLFQELDKKQVMGKVVARDREGDMPLQSAVHSKANVSTIELILDYVPGTKKIMLENRNQANETALELSLNHENADVFKLLLKQCISCEALTDLICVGKANRQCSTLLHQLIQDRRIPHLRACLEVCRECGVQVNLCVVNEKRFTPWQYLLRYNKDELPLVKEIFSILDEHKIPINSLLVNNTTRETMLHKAYRTDNEELKALLEGNESCKVTLDRYKRRPSQRDRNLSKPAPPEVCHAAQLPATPERGAPLPEQPLPATPEQHEDLLQATPVQDAVPSPTTPEQDAAPSPATPEQEEALSPATPGQNTAPLPATPEQHEASSPLTQEQHKVSPATPEGEAFSPGTQGELQQPPTSNTHPLQPPSQNNPQFCQMSCRAAQDSDDSDSEHVTVRNSYNYVIMLY